MNLNLNEYKTFVDNLNDECMDILGDDYTSCWMFACYIHCKYDLPIQENEAFYEVNQQNTFNLDKNGIYSYFMSHKSEMHHCLVC